jgi:hypothetical protein
MGNLTPEDRLIGAVALKNKLESYIRVQGELYDEYEKVGELLRQQFPREWDLYWGNREWDEDKLTRHALWCLEMIESGKWPERVIELPPDDDGVEFVRRLWEGETLDAVRFQIDNKPPNPYIQGRWRKLVQRAMERAYKRAARGEW